MIGSQIRAQIRERAQNACEYCHLHQDDSPLAALHVEHIINLVRKSLRYLPLLEMRATS